MVRRARLTRKGHGRKPRLKRIGLLKALKIAATSKNVQKRLESRKNYAIYSIMYNPSLDYRIVTHAIASRTIPSRTDIEKVTKKNEKEFRKNIEKQIHNWYPHVKIEWAKRQGVYNDFRISNATLAELVGIHGAVSGMAVGGFKL